MKVNALHYIDDVNYKQINNVFSSVLANQLKLVYSSSILDYTDQIFRIPE